MLFRKKREPQPSQEWLAREAEIQRRISAQPELRIGPDEVMWPHKNLIDNAMKVRDYDTLERTYAGLSGFDRTQFVADLMSIGDGETISHDDLEAVVSRDTPFSYLLAVIMAEKLAWDHRGTGTADTVSESGASYFTQYSVDALKYAKMAKELDPTDANALVAAQSLTRIFDREGRLQWAEQWQAIDSWNHLGWTALMSVLDRRWGGEGGDLLMIADHLARNAPEGSYTLALACNAMATEWLTLFQFYDVPSDQASAHVWHNPESASIVDTVYERFVPHAQLTGAAEIRAWGWVTQALYQTRSHHRALEAWNHMNGVVLKSAWTRYTYPLDFAATARANSIRIVTKYENPLPEDANDTEELWDPRLGTPQPRFN